MTNPPKLPQQISANGQEIWDWAAKMARHTHLVNEQRDLSRRIREIGSRCGSCCHWMTSACPMEKHDNKIGRRKGPSMISPKCGKFLMESSRERLAAEWQEKLVAITKELESA